MDRQQRVAVFGAGGKTGISVSTVLRARGVEVLQVGRDRRGLGARLAGCAAAYLIAPNLYADEPAYVAEALDAVRGAAVPRVVYHSVASPYLPQLPHHLGKAVAEDLVRRCGLAWTILQPGAYLQNFDLAAAGGALRVPYRADAPFGFADLDEVARAAALVLLEPGHDGATYELASRRATVAELAAGSGIAVEVVPFRPSPVLSERENAWLAAMFDYYDRHGLPVGTRTLSMLLDSHQGSARLGAISPGTRPGN